MKAETRTVQEILHGDRRFVVPVYQRPYVWTEEEQWQPLWDDLEATTLRLAEARVSGFQKGIQAPAADQGASPHFLGAVVIEDRPVKTGELDTRLIVDGQQRITTLQLLLRGILDAFEAVAVPLHLRARVRKAVRNDDEIVGQSELLKVVPRLAERSDFANAMAAEAPPAKASRFAAARSFFAGQAHSLLTDDAFPSDPYASSSSVEARASLITATVLGLVKLVVIDLEDVDDAQVIFEALNARGTPLSATDLVKNLLFLRAEAQYHNPDDIYESLWRRFDDDADWWLERIGVGHAQRARQDWLLGDWLIAQIGRSINVGRLYGEFRAWLDASGTKAFDALQTLNRYADAYEALNGRRPGASPIEQRAFARIQDLNITVATPLLMWLLVQAPDELPPTERELAIRAIEAFVIRRMATKYQTRTYGQLFVDILKTAQHAESHFGRAVIAALRDQPSETGWPTLRDLTESFETARYYGPGGISRDRLRLLLAAVDQLLAEAAPKSEHAIFDYDALQIEHLIPQEWRTHWPISGADPVERELAEQRREACVNRIGNLTLANQALNPAMSNSPWPTKRAELKKHSKLHLNAQLLACEQWNEEAVSARARRLAESVDKIWPGPASGLWEIG